MSGSDRGYGQPYPADPGHDQHGYDLPDRSDVPRHIDAEPVGSIYTSTHRSPDPASGGYLTPPSGTVDDGYGVSAPLRGPPPSAGQARYDDWRMRGHGPGAISDADDIEHEAPDPDVVGFPSVPTRTGSQSSEWRATPTPSYHAR